MRRKKLLFSRTLERDKIEGVWNGELGKFGSTCTSIVARASGGPVGAKLSEDFLVFMENGKLRVGDVEERLSGVSCL